MFTPSKVRTARARKNGMTLTRAVIEAQTGISRRAARSRARMALYNAAHVRQYGARAIHPPEHGHFDTPEEKAEYARCAAISAAASRFLKTGINL